MASEFHALIQNGAWKLVPYDSSMNVVGSKWVYKIKRKLDGSMERYKSRLVAQGFSQVPYVYFTDTSSLVVKLAIVRTSFSLKDLGSLHYFLGVEAQRDKTRQFLSQRRYILDLLQKTNLAASKPLTMLMAPTSRLSKFQGDPLLNPTQYRNIVGAMQYATLTRPDVAFAVNKACQFLQNPTNGHWTIVKRILRYLKVTIEHGLFFAFNSPRYLVAFSNVD
ncbi:PREDICTED: uncharacterized protein LOC109115298 [Nelumbo nucifera]|uniref:Uncharacterized protein LOC109115298 n=1 Tax=Nelumbo nucifera TaxID=4432 RepID=A0A1U8Q7E0_NELNU|nr:PREDICTED: uncharacterized protein LOC109115298 [Nelumbo nucifera]